MEDTDSEWEKFGAQDPYYGVLTDDKFRLPNINELSLAEFFKSGEDYVDELLGIIDKYYNQKPIKILDFGCGVGRLAIPFSKRSKSVVGVDVSASMLKEAAKNCVARAITNVRFVHSDDDLNGVEDDFDLIHSHIVFQHIPVHRGERMTQRLLERLGNGGIGALHFTYKNTVSKPRISVPGIVKRVIPYYGTIKKVVRGISLSKPMLQMYGYDLNRLMQIFQINGVHEIHARFTKHQEFLGVIFFFKKET